MKVAILGATGFTGEMLAQILFSHPQADVVYLSSRTESPVPYAKMFPRFAKLTDLNCEPTDVLEAAKRADIFILSLPHTVSMDFVPFLLKKNKKVIDLSADYRLKDAAVYKKFYKMPHKDKVYLKQAVYGLPELFWDDVAGADLIANPGCYPTSVILGLYPLLKENLADPDIIVDAKSSITGAGRKADVAYHYSNIASNVWAYKPFVHQHVPEIIQALKNSSGKIARIRFVPHVIGVETGIYSTIHLDFKRKTDTKKLGDIYRKYYGDCPFVRLVDGLPKLKDTANTNFCDIGIVVDECGRFGVVASCIDNLIKGAAGQAVQNMNIMCGLAETAGL